MSTAKDRAVLFLERLARLTGGAQTRVVPSQWISVAKELGFTDAERDESLKRLYADQLIQKKPASESFELTQKGVSIAEERSRMQTPGPKMDDALPDTLEELRTELAHWEKRQHEDEPHSNWWEQVEARLRALRHKEQRLMSENSQHTSPPSTKVQKHALRVLQAVYDKTRNRTEPVFISDLDIGLSQEEAKAAWRYLKDKRLIDTFKIDYTARINGAGVDAIENAEPPPKPTQPNTFLV